MEPFQKLITEYYIPNIQAEILVYLYMVSYKMDAKTEEIAGRFGITRAQFNILNLLSQQYPEPATIGMLKERTVVVKSDVSRIVMRLQKAGLVNCVANSKDRRALDVCISEKGRNLFSELEKNKDELLKPFAALSNDEIMQMKSVLEKLLTKLEE